MTELPDAVEAAIHAFMMAQFDSGECPDDESVNNQARATYVALRATIFEALIYEREVGREESIADEMGAGEDPTDPVGLEIKRRYDEDHPPMEHEPGWEAVTIRELPEWIRFLKPTETPFLKFLATSEESSDPLIAPVDSE
jgi:hypothetical protein